MCEPGFVSEQQRLEERTRLHYLYQQNNGRSITLLQLEYNKAEEQKESKNERKYDDRGKANTREHEESTQAITSIQ